MYIDTLHYTYVSMFLHMHNMYVHTYYFNHARYACMHTYARMHYVHQYIVYINSYAATHVAHTYARVTVRTYVQFLL